MKISIDRAGLAKRAAERFTRRNETLTSLRNSVSPQDYVVLKAKVDFRNSEEAKAHPALTRFLNAMGVLKYHQKPFVPPVEEIKKMDTVFESSALGQVFDKMEGIHHHSEPKGDNDELHIVEGLLQHSAPKGNDDELHEVKGLQLADRLFDLI